MTLVESEGAGTYSPKDPPQRRLATLALRLVAPGRGALPFPQISDTARSEAASDLDDHHPERHNRQWTYRCFSHFKLIKVGWVNPAHHVKKATDRVRSFIAN
jgi:hypothetical protein